MVEVDPALGRGFCAACGRLFALPLTSSESGRRLDA